MRRKAMAVFALLTFSFQAGASALGEDGPAPWSLRGLAHEERETAADNSDDKEEERMYEEIMRFEKQRQHLESVVEGLLRGNMAGADIISHVEGFLMREGAAGKISRNKAIMLRLALGSWLMVPQKGPASPRPMLAMNLLMNGIKDINGAAETIQMQYNHTLGLAYQLEGDIRLKGIKIPAPKGEEKQETQKIRRVITSLTEAEKYFSAAMKIASTETNRAAIETDLYDANYKMISALGLMPPETIDQAAFVRRSRAALNALKEGPMVHESEAVMLKVVRTVLATYVVLDTKQGDIGSQIRINPQLKELAMELLRSTKGNKLIIRRLGNIKVDLKPYRELAAANPIAPADDLRPLLASI